MKYIIFLAGVVIGLIIRLIVERSHAMGTLRIDNSDSDGPYLFVELNRSISELSAVKTVKLAVKVEDFIPQK